MLLRTTSCARKCFLIACSVITAASWSSQISVGLKLITVTEILFLVTCVCYVAMFVIIFVCYQRYGQTARCSRRHGTFIIYGPLSSPGGDTLQWDVRRALPRLGSLVFMLVFLRPPRRSRYLYELSACA